MTQPSTPNDSSTGGYLLPSTNAPADDLELDIQMQALVVGITNLEGSLVLPRWQDEELVGPTPPRIPSISTNWCAVGVMGTSHKTQPVQIHDGAGEGTTTLSHHETLTVLASFYGPRSNGYAELFRDGLFIGQNREALFHQNMNVVSAEEIRRIPEITSAQIRRRSDVSFQLRRCVKRVYPIRNILQVPGTFQTEDRNYT